jgi:hypothetical protein
VSVLGQDFQNPQKQDVFAGASMDGFTAFLKILTEDGHGNEATEFKINGMDPLRFETASPDAPA